LPRLQAAAAVTAAAARGHSTAQQSAQQCVMCVVGSVGKLPLAAADADTKEVWYCRR